MDRRTLTAGLFVLALMGSSAAAQENAPYFQGDRIVVNATINDQPVRLVYDTGAPFTALSGATAKRLNLTATATTTSRIGGVPTTVERSEPLQFRIFGGETRTNLVILPELKTGELDGVLSWKNLLAPVVMIDGVERRVSSHKALPAEGWLRFPLETDNGQLFFELTDHGKPLGRVFIDTGLSHGLRLSPRLWKEWKQEHPDAPLTLEPFRYAFGSMMAHEMTWVDNYQLGDMTFYGCDLGPVAEAKDEAIDGAGKPYLAQLGMRALRSMRIIISPASKELLVQSVSPIPTHNRLGALFMPHAADSTTLVAQVAPGTPAHEAGLQAGDVLITTDGVEYQAEEGRPPQSLLRQFARPAGTVLEITVDRAGEHKQFRVTLRDILR
ncbi:hypothetical protein Pan44_52350 [Caulifigura coniformis]|uniref:PDZ domain-containing protein n=1 Tax=Caulifigura coniformis TaxID=2527983 RepID=A0A517SM30_9PLAN|nr:aspartyl protease family protein [Caulifigura coniformis]QDT57168.1 hypothetical protein Pan44_52350 [Caulifigura coniformis]